jgi:hypothetical protein
MAKVRAPIVEAQLSPASAARRLVDDANRQIREAFRDITGDRALNDSEAVLALTELENHSLRVSAEALRLELAHVQERLKEVYQARGAKVVHVVRSDDGNIIRLVGIDRAAA